MSATCPDTQEAADEAEWFCSRWFHYKPFNSLLILAGETGTGKTHLAKAIAHFCRASSLYAVEKGGWRHAVPIVEFKSWPEVCDGFKEGYYGSIDDMRDAGILILDDLGAEHDPSKNASDKLCQVLSRREREFTVITTNIGPANWNKRFDIRITDRLFRNSVIVDFSGVPSYSMGA